jgi:hypothetical protein
MYALAKAEPLPAGKLRYLLVPVPRSIDHAEAVIDVPASPTPVHAQELLKLPELAVFCEHPLPPLEPLYTFQVDCACAPPAARRPAASVVVAIVVIRDIFMTFPVCRRSAQYPGMQPLPEDP